MPGSANSVPFDNEEAGQPPAAEDEQPTPNDLADYVTPPPKKVSAVAVRYCEARKGAPVPYALTTGADEKP